MKIRSFIVLCYLLTAGLCYGQIRVSSANIDSWIKTNFAGQGIVVGNIKHKGNRISQGTFTSTANILGLPRGLVLSSGNVFNVGGFNRSHNLSTAFADMNQPETDADLAGLVKGGLYDISYVEFDFVPLANSVQFNYQFGSDEYPEYVGTAFNDIFAFFISDETGSRNIALIPGKTLPVSVNTINTKTESEFFIDNNPFSKIVIKRQAPVAEKVQQSFFGSIWNGIKSIFSPTAAADPDRVEILPDQNLVKNLNPTLYRSLQYDGITKKLVSQAYVEPYKKYHLKIAIADVADNIYDSGVFIEDRSLTARRDSLQPGFVDYPDFTGLVDPKLILEGKKLTDILPDSIAIEDIVVYFDFDKSDVLPSEMYKIKRAAGLYNRIGSKYDLYVTGHTDSVGNLDYNLALSKRRNLAVAGELKKLVQGDPPMNISEKAFLQPAARNSTVTGRKENRRVAITFKKKKNE